MGQDLRIHPYEWSEIWKKNKNQQKNPPQNVHPFQPQKSRNNMRGEKMKWNEQMNKNDEDWSVNHWY